LYCGVSIICDDDLKGEGVLRLKMVVFGNGSCLYDVDVDGVVVFSMHVVIALSNCVL
jgi:hypothetical protein